MAVSKNDSQVDGGYPDKFETVKLRGDDGASNTQWSSRDSGDATNGGFTGEANAPMDQPRSYRDLWDGPNQDDA